MKTKWFDFIIECKCGQTLRINSDVNLCSLDGNDNVGTRCECGELKGFRQLISEIKAIDIYYIKKPEDIEGCWTAYIHPGG